MKRRAEAVACIFCRIFRGSLVRAARLEKEELKAPRSFFLFLSLFCFVFYHNHKIKKILIFIYIVRFCYLKGERGESGNEGENGPTGPKVCDNVANFTLISADEHFFQ